MSGGDRDGLDAGTAVAWPIVGGISSNARSWRLGWSGGGVVAVGEVGLDFGQVAAGDAAEEDDLLGLEALDDELGDGLDGFAVEGVFDDGHRVYSANGVSVSPAAGAFMQAGIRSLVRWWPTAAAAAVAIAVNQIFGPGVGG